MITDLICIVVFPLGVFLVNLSFKDVSSKWSFLALMLGIILGISSIWGLYFRIVQGMDNKVIAKAEEMVANGSKVYLDGQEVDLDNIILDNYKVEFKDDKVILSNQGVR